MRRVVGAALRVWFVLDVRQPNVCVCVLARWRSVVSLAGLGGALTALVQQLIVNIEQYCEPRVLFAHVAKLFLLRHGIAQERFVVLAKMSAVERAKYLTTEV